MATISNTPRPGYVFDVTDNVWYPIGVGGHSHGEIPATIADAKGDLIVGTAADTVARLAVGTNGQVLTADSSEATGLKYATPSSGGKVLQVVSATHGTIFTTSSNVMADTGLTATITPTLVTSTIVVAWGIDWRKSSADGSNACNFRILRASTQIVKGISLGFTGTAIYNIGTWAGTFKDSPATTSATTYKIQLASDNNTADVASVPYGANSLGTIVLMEIGA